MRNIRETRSHEDFWFPPTDRAEWFAREDQLFLGFLMRDLTSTINEALEIGVWKGGWSSFVLKNQPSVVMVGVDPYPLAGNVPATTAKFFRKAKISDRFKLVSSLDEVSASHSFDLVHIDGLHTQDAVASDLEQCSARMSDDGVLVVDDYRHFWFPGIAAALLNFVRDTSYCVFAVTENKAYLGRPERAAELQNAIDERLKLTCEGLSAYRNLHDASALSRYEQDPSVHGFSPRFICSSSPR